MYSHVLVVLYMHRRQCNSKCVLNICWKSRLVHMCVLWKRPISYRFCWWEPDCQDIMECNTELVRVWQHATWIPWVSRHAQSALSSIAGFTHNIAPIHSHCQLLQLTLIGIYMTRRSRALRCACTMLFFCSIHMLHNTCQLLGHPLLLWYK